MGFASEWQPARCAWKGYEMPDARCINYIFWNLRADRGMKWTFSDQPDL
jgi:hypothetical protein